MKNRIYFLIGIFILLTTIVSCAPKPESEKHESTSSEELMETKWYHISNDVEMLGEWVGNYIHFGRTPTNCYVSMALVIYQEDDKYFGYLNLDGSEKKDGTESSLYVKERILTEIKENQDMVGVYFLEDFSEEDLKGEMFGDYQKGDLLFLFKEINGEITTIWQDMRLNENEEDLKRGFIQQDMISCLTLINEKDRECFLKALGLSEQEAPFYQYYYGNGLLQLDLYYDMNLRTGIGVFYEQAQEEIHMSGFEVKSWNTEVWEHDKFDLNMKEEAKSCVEEYEEQYRYNEQEQLTYFCSKGIILGLKEQDKDKVVEIEFIYREDGTLEKKKCYYSP